LKVQSAHINPIPLLYKKILASIVLVFKFLLRQLVSLNKTKIICSVTDRKPYVVCGFCGVKISPVIG